jgi:hypothetical protein
MTLIKQWRYGSTHSKPRHKVKLSRQLHVRDALQLGKGLHYTIECEAVWAARSSRIQYEFTKYTQELGHELLSILP